MALISQGFLNDTQSNNLNVTPVIALAELQDDKYVLLDSFSTSNLLLFDTDGNEIQTKPILEKISSVKNAIDYSSKNIKINTFRFSLYNYYDSVTKLTNSESFNEINSFIGKYVILYYKTQSCDKLNLNKNIEDMLNFSLKDNCSIMYYGIVNRISQTDKSISIQAEDFTQDYIKDKELPATKIADLDSKIKEGIEDLDEAKPIPMVYGKVDKAPSVVYKTNMTNNDNFKSLGMIHDSKQISNYFRTTKAPSFDKNYYLYLEDDSDYVMFPYEVTFDSLNGKSYFINPQIYVEEATDILPELENTDASPVLCLGFTFPINAMVDLTGENTFESLKNVVTDENLNPNTDALLNNWGYDKKWFRDDDEFTNSYDPDSVLKAPTKTYSSSDADGSTRWVILQLDKTKKIFEGFLYSRVYYDVDENNVAVNNENSEDIDVLTTKPLNIDLLKRLFEEDVPLDEFYQSLISDTIGEAGEELERTGFGNLFLRTSDDERTRLSLNFKLDYDTSDWLKNFIHSKAKESYDETADTDRILMFERFDDADNNKTQGWEAANMCFKYYVEKTGYESETFYASIEGRKDYTSTEDITKLLALQEEVNVTVNEARLGLDGQLPDFEALVNEWSEYFSSKYEVFPDEVEQGNDVNTFLATWLYSNPLEDKTIDFPLQPNGYFPNLNIKTSSDLDDSTFLNSNQVVGFIIHGLMEKLYINIIDNIVINDEEIKDLAQQCYKKGYDWEKFWDFSSPNYYLLIAYSLYAVPSSAWNWNANLNFREAFLPSLQQYSDYKKVLLRRIFKYLYQSDLNEDSVDSLVTGYLYEWNSFDIDLDTNQGAEDWINSLTPYLDDTISTINKSILDAESYAGQGIGTEVGKRQELYYWNDNPNEYGYSLPHLTELWKKINYDSIKNECFTNLDVVFDTNGVIEKPTDIFINLLSRELGYGLGDNVLDTNFFDHKLIEESRDVYDGWKMGFCIDDNVEAKKLLEDIAKETQSYFSFTPEGNFGLITIKNNYTIDDIDYRILESDVIKYSITRTKREDIITNSKYYYRYDNGLDKYTFNTKHDNSDILNIKSLLPEYNGEEYYNIDDTTAYKEKQLRYHTDTETAKRFQEFELLNNCNQHLIINIDLPLSYTIKCGDILNIPLINNTKAFGLDYSKVEILNGQPVYPLWIVTSTDYGLNSIKVQAYQLHYLGTDGIHNYLEEGEEMVVFANLREFNTTYPTLKNYNYLPPEQRVEGVRYLQGLEIPYGDFDGNGLLDVRDIVGLANLIMNNEYSDLADMSSDGIINIVDIVRLVGEILGD